MPDGTDVHLLMRFFAHFGNERMLITGFEKTINIDFAPALRKLHMLFGCQVLLSNSDYSVVDESLFQLGELFVAALSDINPVDFCAYVTAHWMWCYRFVFSNHIFSLQACALTIRGVNYSWCYLLKVLFTQSSIYSRCYLLKTLFNSGLRAPAISNAGPERGAFAMTSYRMQDSRGCKLIIANHDAKYERQYCRASVELSRSSVKFSNRCREIRFSASASLTAQSGSCACVQFVNLQYCAASLISVKPN